MFQSIVSLTKKFVSIQSTPDNLKALKKILDLALSNLKEYSIERFERDGVRSALIYNTKKRPKKFKILLNGHLDIIPGKQYQYVPRVRGTKLYGAGAMDMKANVACLITAFREVARTVKYPIGLQLVTDEEIGGFNGTKYQIEKGIRADFVIAAEPTKLDIVYKTKGVLLLKISAPGKTAHGAYPWRGENAIWSIQTFLEKLKKRFPSPRKEKWVTTINLSEIETSNHSFNKTPDDCTISLDIRYIPEDTKTILRDIKQLLPKGFTLKMIANEPPLYTNPNNRYIQTLQAAIKQETSHPFVLRGAHGSSDARHFTRVHCASIEFGPIGGGIGSDNEWVDIPSLETYHQILKNFLLALDRF